ncbi:hypothetical protein [Rhizobium sp. FKY42]|uniref:hypothetical protein n=1 Tax=Rhizobium sp. FKY42 TaxID=2562310 RepID=UPI0010BF95D2|nr:hypothetical protein [Rhizobium sp. FKY42]
MIKKVIVAVTLAFACASTAIASSAEDAYDNERDIALDEATREAFLKKHENWKAKDGFRPPVTSCMGDDPMCEPSRATMFVDAKYAYQGVYQAQRNLAFCLDDGCYGAAIPNRNLSCAWRIVIAASGNTKVDALDLTSLKACLSQLDAAGLAAARTQAAAIFKSVYKRNIPGPWR